MPRKPIDKAQASDGRTGTFFPTYKKEKAAAFASGLARTRRAFFRLGRSVIRYARHLVPARRRRAARFCARCRVILSVYFSSPNFPFFRGFLPLLSLDIIRRLCYIISTTQIPYSCKGYRFTLKMYSSFPFAGICVVTNRYERNTFLSAIPFGIALFLSEEKEK